LATNRLRFHLLQGHFFQPLVHICLLEVHTSVLQHSLSHYSSLRGPTYTRICTLLISILNVRNVPTSLGQIHDLFP
jgi:hypothetical protein